MEKASRAIRRSGAKLKALGSSHGTLNVLLADIKEVKNGSKMFMEAQCQAAQDMMKWAATEENRAVQDVISNIAELYLVWTGVQKNFISYLKDYRDVFEMVLEGEKKVERAKENLDYCSEKESKFRLELKKCGKRALPRELRQLESRVEYAVQAKEMAQLELIDSEKENEAVKLIRLKEGLLKMAGAYVEMGHKAGLIFSAQRNVIIQLPDVHGQELEAIPYSGAATTRHIVDTVKDKIKSYTPSNVASDPPPPYTVAVPAQNTVGLINSSRSSIDRPDMPAPQRPALPMARGRHSCPEQITSIRGYSRPGSSNSGSRSGSAASDPDLPSYNSVNNSMPLISSSSEVFIRQGSYGSLPSDDSSVMATRERAALDAIVHTSTVHIVQEAGSGAGNERISRQVNKGREETEHSSGETVTHKLYPDIKMDENTSPVPYPRKRDLNGDGS